MTSQLFFPYGASEAVYRAAPYLARGAVQDTNNASYGIARAAGPRAFARVVEAAGRWQAELVVGVLPVG